jgi:hypothetical protein
MKKKRQDTSATSFVACLQNRRFQRLGEMKLKYSCSRPGPLSRPLIPAVLIPWEARNAEDSTTATVPNEPDQEKPVEKRDEFWFPNLKIATDQINIYHWKKRSIFITISKQSQAQNSKADPLH